MDTAVLARIAHDHGRFIDSLELIFARLDFEFVDWNNSDKGEQRAVRLPALGTAARMVMCDVAGELNFYRAGLAVADERAAAHVLVAWLDAVVD